MDARPSHRAFLRLVLPLAMTFTGVFTGVLTGVPAAPQSPSPGCGAAPPVEPGESVELTLEHGELLRSYRLHLPPSYDTRRPVSLVLSFHGYTGSALYSERSWTGLSEHADREGYVVVYPQSTSFRAEIDGRTTTVTSWNDLACNASPGPLGPTCSEDADPYPCPPECGDCGRCNWCSCHDDVGFVEALLDELERSLCLDRKRLFAVGFSNGAMFVQRLGCLLGDRLAAVAPLHGTLAKGLGCAPVPFDDDPSSTALPPTVSLLLIAGRDDTTVPLDGSRAGDGYLYTPVEEVLGHWARSQRCAEESKATTTGLAYSAPTDCRTHPDCESRAEVLLCTWEGAHVWPKDQRPWGNDLLWSFFSRNPK